MSSSEITISSVLSLLQKGGELLRVAACLLGTSLLAEWIGRKKGVVVWGARIGAGLALVWLRMFGRQSVQSALGYPTAAAGYRSMSQVMSGLWAAIAGPCLALGVYLGVKYILRRFLAGRQAVSGIVLAQEPVREMRQSFYLLLLLVAAAILVEFLPVSG